MPLLPRCNYSAGWYRMLVALWVFNGKHGERNREKVKQENGNQDNDDTHW